MPGYTRGLEWARKQFIIQGGLNALLLAHGELAENILFRLQIKRFLDSLDRVDWEIQYGFLLKNQSLS